MNILLDTHAIIWYIEDNPLLNNCLAVAIADPGNKIFISAASVWEMSIKVGLGKLKLTGSVRDILNEYRTAGAVVFSITPEHALTVESLPWHHRDPFDRMLIAQALHDNFVLATQDDMFDRYQVPRIQ